MIAKERFQKAFAEGNGSAMAEALTDTFNAFGQPKIDGLTEEEMKGIRLCGYLTLFELCDWWEASGCDGWDERKKASALFAYRNKNLLSEQFKKLTGLDAFPERLPFDANYNLGRRMELKPNRDAYVNAGYAWMPEFTAIMYTEHSTLQQSFIRWFTKEILFKDYPEGIFEGNNDRGTISFPFI